MKILTVTQGSQEWLSARATKFTASEASIMMGRSKNVSRNELLHMKATGTEQEFSEWFQRHVLDKGHEVEAKARPIAERIIGQELFPVTALSDDEMLLASFDGLTLMEDICWECKQYNAEKVASLQIEEMPACDYWQVIQQLVVSGAEKCLYMVTDGTEENTHHIWVTLPHDAEAILRAGWDQFAIDATNYQMPEQRPEPKAETPQELPALVVELVGEVRGSNLATFKDAVLARIQSVKTDLVTDDDFATAEATVKFFNKAEKDLESVKQHALAQTASIDELFKTIDLLQSEMRTKRLTLNKQVKDQKDQLRVKIINSAKAALKEHIKGLEADLSDYRLPEITCDIATAMKGKKTLKSLQSAADDVLAMAKVEASKEAYRLKLAIDTLNQGAKGFEFLFNDRHQLVRLSIDHLSDKIKNRIHEHQEREKAELAAKAEREAQQQANVETHTTQPAPETVLRQEPVTTSPLAENTAPVIETSNTVTIDSQELQQLRHKAALFDALAKAGVQHWDGYQQAVAPVLSAA